MFNVVPLNWLLTLLVSTVPIAALPTGLADPAPDAAALLPVAPLLAALLADGATLPSAPGSAVG